MANPYLPNWEYIPDGEPHVFGDRVYVYGSHDYFNGNVFCLGDYVCYSAPVTDLTDWKYEGVIYEKTTEEMTKEYSAIGRLKIFNKKLACLVETIYLCSEVLRFI